MQAEIVTSRMRQFIAEHFPRARQGEIRDEDPLLEKGILDSLGVLSVVTFMEEEFGVLIEDDDLVPENFQSILSMVRFIAYKHSGPTAS